MASPERPPEDIRKQLLFFQQKLENSKKTFSVPITVQVLTEILNDTEKHQESPPTLTVALLRRLMEQRSHHQKHKYLTWLVDFFDYMRDLLANFSRRVEAPLARLTSRMTKHLQHFSDSDTFGDIGELCDVSPPSTERSRRHLRKMRSSRSLATSLLEDGEEGVSLDMLQGSTAELQRALQDTESELPPAAEPLLALFVECLRHLEICGSCALSALDSLPPPSAVQDYRRLLERLLEASKTRDGDLQEQLKEWTDSLQRLLAREERVQELEAQLFSLEQNIKDLRSELADFPDDELTQLTYSQLAERQTLQQQLTTVKFRRDLLSSDLEIELISRPDIVRLTDDAQEEVEKTELALEDSQGITARLQVALNTIDNAETIETDATASDKPNAPKPISIKSGTFVKEPSENAPPKNKNDSWKSVEKLPAGVTKFEKTRSGSFDGKFKDDTIEPLRLKQRSFDSSENQDFSDVEFVETDEPKDVYVSDNLAGETISGRNGSAERSDLSQRPHSADSEKSSQSSLKSESSESVYRGSVIDLRPSDQHFRTAPEKMSTATRRNGHDNRKVLSGSKSQPDISKASATAQDYRTRREKLHSPESSTDSAQTDYSDSRRPKLGYMVPHPPSDQKAKRFAEKSHVRHKRLITSSIPKSRPKQKAS